MGESENLEACASLVKRNVGWRTQPIRATLKVIRRSRIASATATTAQHSLPGGALPPYRGRSFTGRIASASPDGPEPKVRIQLPPPASRANSEFSESQLPATGSAV
jgi:hypothetical protein